MYIKQALSNCFENTHIAEACYDQAKYLQALAITMLALIILGTCAFTKVGIFTNFDYSHYIGFGCAGLLIPLFLTGVILLAYKIYKLRPHPQSDSHSCKIVQITDEERRNAISYRPPGGWRL